MDQAISERLPAREGKTYPFLIDLLIRLVRQKPLGTTGGVIVLALMVVGIFADLIAPYGFNQTFVGERLGPPTSSNLLGTDSLGRDALSRIIYGARISMYVGLGASGIAVVLATTIGTVSGYLGGRVDTIIQRFVDAWICIPALMLILAMIAIIGPGLVQVIVVLGLLYGIGQSRVMRSAAIAIRNNIYFEAARAVGCPTWRMVIRHVLPNVMAPIIILFTITTGGAIIAEATISFLGFGIPPPIPSWGGMLSERRFMLVAPWLALWPGLVLAIVVYGINMLGDAFRDLLDPRLRGGLGRYAGVKIKKPKA